MTIPYRLANGPGNAPDADKFMANYDYLTALAFGNQMKNGGFETWLGGTSFTNPANASAVATGWTWLKSGTSAPTADVSREASIIDTGTYSGKVNITVAGSSNSLTGFYQVIPNSTWFRGFTVLTGFRVKLSTANKARVKITDGTTTAYSSYHTGGGAWENLQATLLVGAGATSVTVSIEITSDFTGAIYVDSSYSYVIPDSMASGAKSYLEHIIFMSQKLAVDGGDVFGNIAMNGAKLTGLGAGSANGDSVRYEQLNPGKIVQIVSGSMGAIVNTTSATYADANLTATITPLYSNSKILIFLSIPNYASRVSTALFKLLRDSTSLADPIMGSYMNTGVGGDAVGGVTAYMETDTPGGTSAYVYKLQIKTSSAGTQVGTADGTTSRAGKILLMEEAQ